MGALYLQDGVCLLPDQPDLTENLAFLAASIAEMEGTSHLFSAEAVLPGGAERIADAFRTSADARLGEIVANLEAISGVLDRAVAPSDWERAEQGLKRERVAYLHVRRRAYFGSSRETEVDVRLDRLRRRLDDRYRSGSGKGER